MKKIIHEITHYFQPTNSTCGYAALATLLSYYGARIKPEELVSPEAMLCAITAAQIECDNQCFIIRDR